MNKAVMISIQPYYVFLIIAQKMGWNILRDKKVEVRKDFPKDKYWNKKAHIYCSKSKKSFNRIPKEYQPLMRPFLGKVICEFVCDMIEGFQIEGALGVRFKRFCALAETCLTVKEMREYAGIKPKLYGWHISQLKIYDKPKELSEFSVIRKYKISNETILSQIEPLTRPFQSWGYVEELEI